jgi:hypothetical protein
MDHPPDRRVYLDVCQSADKNCLLDRRASVDLRELMSRRNQWVRALAR